MDVVSEEIASFEDYCIMAKADIDCWETPIDYFETRLLQLVSNNPVQSTSWSFRAARPTTPNCCYLDEDLLAMALLTCEDLCEEGHNIC